MRVELTSHDLNDRLVSRLLDVERIHAWDHADAVAALRHQLAAKLLPDLALSQKAAMASARPCQPPDAHSPWESGTFGEQLLSPTPALEVLSAIKEYGRTLSQDQNSPLAGMPATILYYAAIAAAKLRFHLKITRLTERELVEGYAWAMAQDGAETLVQLFHDAIKDHPL